MTSGEIDFPSVTVFSSASLTLRVSASVSSEGGVGSSGSASRVTFARSAGVSARNESIFTRASPCTRRRMRPSGSLSIRITAAAVPTV